MTHYLDLMFISCGQYFCHAYREPFCTIQLGVVISVLDQSSQGGLYDFVGDKFSVAGKRIDLSSNFTSENRSNTLIGSKITSNYLL